jgi:hypothetical protein
MTFIQEHAMRKVLRGYAKNKTKLAISSSSALRRHLIAKTNRLQGNVTTKDV